MIRPGTARPRSGRPLPAVAESIEALTPLARLAVPAGCLTVAALVIAYALARYELAAFPVLLAVAPAVWAVLRPRSFAIVLLATLIIVEPNALDFTGPLSRALYYMPLGIAPVMPLTISPIECFALLLMGSVLLRGISGRRERWGRVPWLTLAVPVVVLLGLAYGMAKGADHRLAYHEMRGMVFAMIAFALAVELRTVPPRAAALLALAVTGLLGVLLLIRYFAYTRGGEIGRPLEFAYAHESVIFLVVGLVLAGALFLRAHGPLDRTLLALHGMLMVAATLVTGRRAGTLVLLVAGAVMLVLLWRRRPLATTILGLALLACGSVYLAAYWNQSYGGVAQPARAVRSYFDPNLRDQSSDQYRALERASIVATIDSSPALGVGFGRPFFSWGGLPQLDFWPLQYYTPHQNILWLWLKMGVVGIAVVLGVWLIAMGRVVRAFTTAPRRGPMPVLPLVLGGLFTAYLFFASVDITFSATRSAVPLGVGLGLALSMLPAWTPPRGREARRAAEEAL